MQARRLRAAVALGAVAMTAGVALAVSAHPFPAAPEPSSTVPSDPQAALAAREARALARLAAAERHLRVLGAHVAPPPAAAPPPAVALAPAPAAPVTSSGSS